MAVHNCQPSQNRINQIRRREVTLLLRSARCRFRTPFRFFPLVKLFLLRSSLHEFFANDKKAVFNRKRVWSKSRLPRLKPLLDSILSFLAEGCSQKSRLDFRLKDPMILDEQHRTNQFFITFIHTSNGHTRLKQTRHILPIEILILKTGSILNRLIRCCYDCRGLDAYAAYPENPRFRFLPSNSFLSSKLD